MIPNSKNSRPVNESVLLTMAFVALCTKPFFDSEFAKSVGSGIGGLFGGIGSLFTAAFGKKDDKKDDKKNDKKDDKKNDKKDDKKNDKKDGDSKSGDGKSGEEGNKSGEEGNKSGEEGKTEDNHEAFASMMGVMIERAKKDAPDDTKDLLDKMQGCLRDENGKATDPTQLGDKIAKATGKSIDEIKKSTGLDKVTEDQMNEAQKNLNNVLSKLSPEELKKEAQTANENTQKMAQQAQTGEGEPKSDPKDPKSEPKSEPKSDPKDPDEGATVSDEEVTDPETGKKVKRKVYTGKFGGRYWYNDGDPHDAEHKHYLTESLSHWLGRRLV